MSDAMPKTKPLGTAEEILSQGGVLIGFGPEFGEPLSPGQAARYARDLEKQMLFALAEQEEAASIRRIRIDLEAQDLGTVLGVILGAKATIVIAKGIAQWFAKNNQAALKISTRNGDVLEVTRLNSGDVEGVAKQLAKALKELE